jgi:hypothetical protein
MTAATADVVEPLGYAEYGQRVRSAIVDSCSSASRSARSFSASRSSPPAVDRSQIC